MIARFRALLPFKISVRQGDDIRPQEFSQEAYRIRISPPLQASLDPAIAEAESPVPSNYVIDQLEPAIPQNPVTTILLDGVPAIQANLLQIDFLRPDFDRRQPGAGLSPEEVEAQGDPSIRFTFDVANSFLARIRTITRGSQVRAIGPREVFWRIEYLGDDEKPLAPVPGFMRRKVGVKFFFQFVALTADIWSKAQALPTDFTPQPWDTLLLDAEALLPEVGATIVVAFSALETFITFALNELAPLAKVPPELWNWINEREDYLKEPSISERFDILLRILTAKSLKDEKQLWEAFQKLRRARNKFSHEGKPVADGKALTVADVMQMIGQTKSIIDWVEGLLPEGLRRPKLDTTPTMNLTKILVAPSGV